MPSITNEKENSLAEALKKILPSSEQLDALVGYFYFSGFQEIYKELQDQKIRILVGMEIDGKILDKISAIDLSELDNHLKPQTSTSKIASKENYYNEFSTIFNKTDLFDNSEALKAFDVFINKIKDGTLEIKKTSTNQHGKFYIFHYKEEFSQGGLQEGVVITGSSNLTYSGLKGQGEHNLILREDHYYNEHYNNFEKLWEDSDNIIIADQESSDEFLDKIKERIWLYAKPSPFHLYLRVLDEYFRIGDVEKMKTPSEITDDKYYSLRYQVDAINLGIDRINKFGGVIVADVVGLGKSIIASAIAHNLGLNTVIIAPPHLCDQWEDYRTDFNFNARVFSTGKVEEALEKYKNSKKELLIILDEAHKHRNEDTESYKKLHQLCAGHKVVALTATPFNNDPKDIYAIIKLFNTPGQSTLKTVENLSMEFHDLFKEYKKIRRDLRLKKGDGKEDNIKIRSGKVADRLRIMIEPVVIRRSRLDLDAIEEYKKDLEKQDFSFAKVNDPELLEYELGDLSELYIETLNKISSEDSDFKSVRYKPATYIRPGSDFFDRIKEKEESAEETEQRIKQGQTNVAKFMRRLLVRRFESSVYAFDKSLNNMIVSAEKMMQWLVDRKEVPVFKKGNIPEVDDLEDMDEGEADSLIAKLEEKGMIRIPALELDENFKKHLKNDIELLKKIQDDWFGEKKEQKDPKFDLFFNKVKKQFTQNANKKIIVFTEFSDTADYLNKKIKDNSFEKIFKYSSGDSSKENKKIIKKNFDAGLPDDEQSNDYDLLVATDAISEGYNLHRAGIVINYDIPYNPTKVIQRVGRINRINKKVFNELSIFNFFPTVTGEQEVKTKAISSLKMNLIHSLIGEDTRYLSSDEELRSYFVDQYKEENSKFESRSWDAKHRNVWLNFLNDIDLADEVKKIPHRTRIARDFKNEQKRIIAFGKKGHNYIFAKGESEIDINFVSPEEALNLFEAQSDEKSIDTTADFDLIYQKVKDQIFKDNTHPTIRPRSRRHDASARLEILADKLPSAKDWCNDVIKIIKDFDALPNGLLKTLSSVDMKKEPKDVFTEYKKLIPDNYITNIFKMAEKAKSDDELIVLSEQLL
ncbi:helicase [Candidatus Parcubacteria bacterium]|nr:helicase [Candidatus Parcubacteria bacterium]